MKKTPLVLIAGGSGMVGSQLSRHLLSSGFSVCILTRKKNPLIPFEQSVWNPESLYMDEALLREASFIVNLSGAGIADKPWTKKRKQEIIESRVKPTKTLVHYLKNNEHAVKAIVNASATGIYPKNQEQVMTETCNAADDFLAQTVLEWENVLTSAPLPESLRKVIYRFGIILSAQSGALPEIIKPLGLGLALCPGNGLQTVSWVHIDDVCRAIVHALQDNTVNGIYNVTAPHPVNMQELLDTAIKTKNIRAVKISVPAFVLKLFIGERSTLLLDSIRVSSERLISSGFEFQFPVINDALKHLLKTG